MRQTLRRFISVLPLLAVLALPQTAWAQAQQEVSYYAWNDTGSGITGRWLSVTNYKVLDSNTSLSDSGEFGIGDNREWDNGGYKWVVVKGNVTINALVVIGEAHLILTDGCKLTCTGGVNLEKGNTLNIYGQSANGLGASEGQLLAVNTEKSNAAGIGSRGNSNNYDAGDLYIHGGNITAKGNKNAAGIGGGNNGSGGKVVIYCGTVSATGGEDGAGIGGGWPKGAGLSQVGGSGCHLTIYDGIVTAQGGDDAAGIGGGGYEFNIVSFSRSDNYGTTIIKGGTVTAKGGKNGAGIGGGNGGLEKYSNYLEITGGTVTATGGDDGAGLGGGYNGTMYIVRISGGTVIANGGNDAPGIGGQVEPYNGAGLTISGNAKVTATGAGDGSGIGSGHLILEQSMGGLFPVTIQGGEVTAKGAGDGAGIGSGEDTYGMCLMGDVTITGGTVMAVGGSSCRNGAIGGNKNNTAKITLDGMRVSSGSSLTLKTASERLSAISDKENPCVKIEPCDHAAFGNYTYIDDNDHTAHCLYCDYSKQQAHEYTGDKCACGKKKEAKPETVSITLYRAKDATSGEYDKGLLLHVVKGEKYTITTCNAPEGLTFMGWMQDPSEAPDDYEMRDGDFLNLVNAGKELTPSADVNLYARYRYRYTDEWTWSDDWSSATVTIRQGDKIILENKVAEISDNSLEPTAENPNGTFGKLATYAWTKGNGIVYNFSDIVSRPVSLALTLSDNADNSALLKQAYGVTYQTVTLSGRTLYKDGSWNTLCLPFAVTTASGPLSGDGVVAQVLDAEKSSLSDDGKLALTFKDAPATIPAGLPFIIKWNAESADIVSPTFNDVTITTPQPASANFRGGSFVGQFSPFQITDDNINTIILLTDNNTLGYSKSTRTLHSCRAHFEVVRNRVSGARLMTGYSITFGPSAEADPTAVRSVTVGGDDNDGWYTLGGQRLSSRPTRQGIYVRQGRKVVIKQ
jgi:hypothetical protein